MQKKQTSDFKSLITKEDYERLIKQFKGKGKTDFQTNHYFDTARFSLKALDTSLRVRERDDDDISLTYKRKKGYNMDVRTVQIDKDKFHEIRANGAVNIPEIDEELAKLIKDQKLINFLSLSTLRLALPYYSGTLAIDKSEYLGATDYEIEYSTESYHQGKDEFIKIIGDLNINYKKCDKKIQRAYNRLKEIN